MKVYVIVKLPYDGEEVEVYEKPDSTYYSLSNDMAANLISADRGFEDYISRNGYHFTKQLAQYASEKMVNSNRTSHKWTPEQIESKLKMYGLNDKGYCTIGDITYLANMAYADFYPTVLKDEMSCIRYALSVAKDPDGYDGIVFSRWLADMKAKLSDIEWKKFM